MDETNSSDCSAQDAIQCLGHLIIALTSDWLHNPVMKKTPIKRTRSKRVAIKLPDDGKSLTKVFDAFGVEDNDDNTRVLTKSQWIAELRGSEQSQ